jgi:DNA-binding beta-propeller fold protein YncE
MIVIALSMLGCRCASTSGSASQDANVPDAGGYETTADTTTGTASLPLVLVADVPLPGAAVRWDYQDLDPAKGNLVIAHMNDASVVVVKTSDGSVVKTIPGIPTARGVIVADDVGRIFVTSAPDTVVILDNDSLAVIARVTSGSGPDGIGWDPKDKIVGVSDQGDGAASLLANSGDGARTQIPLGTETGNIVYDPTRGVFWITVVASSPPDRLFAIDPVAKKATTSVPLPGCDGAHGLRIAPDGRSALIACEGNDKVARVDLVGDAHAIDVAASGAGPDVLAIDPGLGWLYVAAESGNLVVFDLAQPGLVKIDDEHPGDASHTVAVDPSTHHVFFPLQKGPSGTPVLRIMKPAGT